MEQYLELASWYFRKHPVVVVIVVGSLLLIISALHEAWQNRAETRRESNDL